MNWEIAFVTFCVFAMVVIGMAIGVIISNKRLKGSCGGIKMVMGSKECDICEFKDKCEKELANSEN